MTRTSTIHVRLLAALFGCGLGACAQPSQDDFRSGGGIAPDPFGVIEGSVVYVGPPPACDMDGDEPTRVRGRVVLTLFEYDNPPPPEGRARGAKNLLVISADELFSRADCGRGGANISRSVAFRWPGIELGHGASVDYQIRGFFDADEDMNPFFSVKNLPTAGDVVGAAIADLSNPALGLLRVRMPSREAARDGHVERNVTVALRELVHSERPLFQLNPHRVLSAQTPIAPVLGATGLDVPATVRGMWQSTCATGPGTEGCGFALASLTPKDVGDTLEVAGVEHDFSPEHYAFFLEPVDVKKIRIGKPDVALPDGEADPHPLLGAGLGVKWSTPIVLFTRVPLDETQGELEARAGVPGVRMIGSVLPDEAAIRRVAVGSVDVAVPPLAVLELSADPSCRVLAVPPGNLASTYESSVATCTDLPTGAFAVTALQGIAGGSVVEEPNADVSDSGIVIDGGRFSGQSWTIPNELASAEQVGEENVLSSQGAAGLFLVHDPAPDEQGSCEMALDPTMGPRPIAPRTVCKAGESPFGEDALGQDTTVCLPIPCCEAIAHLCDVPLCPAIPVPGAEALRVRTGPTEIAEELVDGRVVPNCVPFAMPAQCCGT